MKDSYYMAILLFSGCLTLIMSAFVPVAGGGASIILIVSIPFFITLALVFAWLYWVISKKSQDSDIRLLVFCSLLFFMLVLSLFAYPFK